MQHHIGLIGDKIHFTIEDNGKGGLKALSFHDLNYNTGANFEEHTQPLKQPKLEFTGFTAPEITMTIELSSTLGFDPWTEYQNILEVMKSGEANPVVIGGRLFGSYKWVITSIANVISKTWIDGRMMRMSLQITLKEDSPAAIRNANFGMKTYDDVPPVSEQTPPDPGYDTYTVVDGDCLWKIATMFYGNGADYPRIFEANRDQIDDDFIIYTGQVFKIPR